MATARGILRSRCAIPGSLENYTANVLRMEQITIAIPAGPDADAAHADRLVSQGRP